MSQECEVRYWTERSASQLIQHARLLLWIGLSKKITDHLSEWRCLIGSKRLTQPIADDLWRRILRNLMKMIRWITHRLRRASTKVLLQDTA